MMQQLELPDLVLRRSFVLALLLHPALSALLRVALSHVFLGFAPGPLFAQVHHAREEFLPSKHKLPETPSQPKRT
jgi:hypothetical protein